MAEVVLSRRAVRDLDRLDPPDRKRIVDKLRQLASDPLHNATKLTDPRIGSFRHRVGPFRVVFDFEADRVTILRIGHRRDIYR